MESGRFVRDPSAPGEGLDTRPSERSPGAFLGRLWTLFGPPDEITDSGYTYGIRDLQAGVRFSAYSGASGPAFGGDPRREAEAAPVLRCFDRLLQETPPSECAVVVEFAGGSLTIGVRDGDPFEQLDRDR
jgi:hypothetical protein